MKVESWALVSELFCDALELPPAERAALLESSGSSAEVRREVERLLALHERNRRPAPEPGALLAAAALTSAATPAPGSRIGPYTLVRVLGSGGMGTVFEALQSRPQRTVALKTLRVGFSSSERKQRFLFEAEVLGNLRHPAIAQIYEAGMHTENGESFPWFAMELVAGARDVLAFARERGLSRAERLTLFAEVCHAVHHGHQKGVIHRDLKAGNILVDSEGRVKVIDFGVARASHVERDRATRTQAGQLVGTLATMSPEQLSGAADAVDARSDVYSLGVVLYELVAGRPPYDLGGLALEDALRRVQEARPERPADVPLELHWVLSRALEKEPARRYASASEFAADLSRLVRHQPVSAGPPSRLYLARKFVRRHTLAVAASAALALALVGGVLGTWSQKRRADREALSARASEELATRRAEDVLRLSALQDLEDLAREAARLWPAHAQGIGAYEGWLARARRLVADLPIHEAKLEELRACAARDAAAVAGAASAAPLFADGRDRWWHGQLAKLVDELRAFADAETGLASGGTSPVHGWGVERRLAFARSLRDGFAPGGGHARAWERALPEIRAAYPGLALSPQVGLVPLGPDPDSGLWEFAHLASGEPAARAPDGRLVLGEESGLVLVLLRGGAFAMGAQARDPGGESYDALAQENESPVRRVELAPFFLSKHEMTQGQWLRFTGTNPSIYGADTPPVGGGRQMTLLNPVEFVSWTSCAETLARLGLELPTEAQWEYAARGETASPWWTGEDVAYLEGAANLADSFCKRYGGPTGWVYEEWLDDGSSVHAQVGSYSANPFGLHDVAGNVWEWCRDLYSRYESPAAAGDGAREPTQHADRVTRGGGFSLPAALARSAYRGRAAPEATYEYLGVRPARRVEP